MARKLIRDLTPEEQKNERARQCAVRAKRRRDNPEKVKEQRRRSAAKRRLEHPKGVADREARYRLNNPEKIKERGVKYRLNNSEKIKAKDAGYRLSNSEKIIARNMHYNNKKRQVLAVVEAMFVGAELEGRVGINQAA